MALFRWFILRRLAQEPRADGADRRSASRWASPSCWRSGWRTRARSAGFEPRSTRWPARRRSRSSAPAWASTRIGWPSSAWLREWGDVSPVIEGDAMALVEPGPRRSRARARRRHPAGPADSRLSAASQTASGAADRASPFCGLLIDPASRLCASDGFAPSGTASRSAAALSPVDGRRGARRSSFARSSRNEGPARVLDGNFVLMDIAAAQWAFDRLGRVDRVDVRLADPARLDEAERVIGVAAARRDWPCSGRRDAVQQVEQMLAAFQFNLAALSYVALLVGLFLVYNTVVDVGHREARGDRHAARARRRAPDGARAVSRRGRWRSESPVAPWALPLGWALAHAAVGFTSSTVTTLYVAEAAGVPALSWIDVWAPSRLAWCWRWPLRRRRRGKRAGVSPLDAIRSAARRRDRLGLVAPPAHGLGRCALQAGSLATRQAPVERPAGLRVRRGAC